MLSFATCRDVVDTSPGVKWGDVAGLDEAKRVLRENVVLPLLLPDVFQGIRRPIKVRGAGCSCSMPSKCVLSTAQQCRAC